MLEVLEKNCDDADIVCLPLTQIFAEHGKLSLTETESVLSKQSIADINGAASQTKRISESRDGLLIKKICGLINKFGLDDSRGNLMAQFSSKPDFFRFLLEMQKEFQCINRKTLMRISDLMSSDSIYDYILMQELQ